MNKSVMISVKPDVVRDMAKGERKIIALRSPKVDLPTKMYIYETKGRYVQDVRGAMTKYAYGCGKVVGEADLMKIGAILVPQANCLVYSLHIDNVDWYKKPKEVTDFERYEYPLKLRKAPVGWCYVKEV